MKTLYLTEKQINYLTELISWYYECGQECKSEASSAIVSVLNYIIDTSVTDTADINRLLDTPQVTSVYPHDIRSGNSQTTVSDPFDHIGGLNTWGCALGKSEDACLAE